ncbi:hypothetical protein [Peribacillus asahii]|uniref:hypothetical protein n=1 Tax=Peribacillus asahii TaxID=228899 RepID=UPI002079FD57|nr:hypothetical protein [Peribacillus asahii]USK58342.1 hypothetical protein LIT37_13850 [Peribacillus asahii]
MSNFFDKKGKVVDSFVRGPGTAYLDNTACNYKYFVTFSDYDEKQKNIKVINLRSLMGNKEKIKAINLKKQEQGAS